MWQTSISTPSTLSRRMSWPQCLGTGWVSLQLLQRRAMVIPPVRQNSVAPVNSQAPIFNAGTRHVPASDGSNLVSRPIISTWFIASL